MYYMQAAVIQGYITELVALWSKLVGLWSLDDQESLWNLVDHQNIIICSLSYNRFFTENVIKINVELSSYFANKPGYA